MCIKGGKRIKLKKIVKKEEMENINIVSYSFFGLDGEFETWKITNDCENIVFESFINEKLEQKKEIDHEEWKNFLDILLSLLIKKKYIWNKHYFVGLIKNKEPWKLKIISKNGEYIEIENKKHYIHTRQIERVLEYFSCIYFEKWNSYKHIPF